MYSEGKRLSNPFSSSLHSLNLLRSNKTILIFSISAVPFQETMSLEIVEESQECPVQQRYK